MSDTSGLEAAVRELRRILAADTTSPEWRWNVRRRLSEVRDALGPEAATGEAGLVPAQQSEQGEEWLTARTAGSERRTRQLQARAGMLAVAVLDRLDAATIVRQVTRLLHDLEHQLQRDHDLAYDAVGLDLGGSE